LAILGDVSAARTHDLARAALAIKGFDAPGHLQEVIREAARCWGSQTSSPEGVRSLGEAFCRRLDPGEVVPRVGDAEVQDCAKKLQAALDKAGVSVPAGTLGELARVVRPSDAGSPELVEGIKCLGGEAWGVTDGLVDLVIVTTGVRYTVEQFGEFMDIVAKAFPEEWQSEGARAVDLTDLARDVLRAFSGQAQQYQVHMDGTGLSPEKLLVEVKYGQVLLAALTLVDNAVYAAREAGNQARVMLETGRVDARPTLLISNNGSPIPEELECKIFKGPVPSKKSHGMGYGLLLAGGLVRANHGIIQLRKKCPEGMTTIELSFEATRS
jgi:signal transduction histidine kinase